MSVAIRLVGIGLTVVAIGFGAAGCGNGIKDKVNDAKDATLQGGAESSFFKARNLKAAIDKIEAKAGGDLIELDVYPGHVEADVSTGSESEGKRYSVNTRKELKPSKLQLTGPGKLADNIFPIADVDPAAVQSMVDAVAKKEGKTADDMTYVLIRIGAVSGKAEMNVYVDGGSFYTAGLDGSGLKNPAGDVKQAAGEAQNVADCVRKAGSDVDKLQACSK